MDRPGYNETAFLLDLCTLDQCPVDWTAVGYRPSIPGNAIYLAIFVLLLLAQIGLGVKYRTWGFLVGMFFGILLEALGYISRLLLYNSPFNFDLFLMNIICLTIGPAFLAASIYISLGRVIVIYGADLAPFSPRTYTIVFIIFDFISLLLQAIGGAFASTSDRDDGEGMGVNIMVAGLAFQVFSLVVFIAVFLQLTVRLHRASEAEKNPAFASLRANPKFKYFRYAIWIATILIFIRCVYRVVELQSGYDSDIASNEVAFMILEGPMIFIAITVLTVFHPGLVMKEQYHLATWNLRKKKDGAGVGHKVEAA